MRFVRKPEVLAMFGFSNSTLYLRIKEGRFPAPTKLDPAGRIVVWPLAQLEKIADEIVGRSAVNKPKTRSPLLERSDSR
jgi:predicted DNA-binding transcriptional regulator AlpA